MPKFFFQIIDRTSAEPIEVEHDFATAEEAKRQARTAMAEMARDGLPEEPLNMLTVEVFDAERKPIIELRLVLEEIPK